MSKPTTDECMDWLNLAHHNLCSVEFDENVRETIRAKLLAAQGIAVENKALRLIVGRFIESHTDPEATHMDQNLVLHEASDFLAKHDAGKAWREAGGE